MNILVTGSAGFVGSRISNELNAAGIDITKSGDADKVSLCDLLDPLATERCIAAVKPDIIIHTAARLKSPTQDQPYSCCINIAMLNNVLISALRHDVRRIIFISSAMIYGESYSVTEANCDTFAPANWYAKSKLCCEQILKAASRDIQIISLRTASILGPNPHSDDLVHSMIQSINETGKVDVFGDGSARRQFVDLDDFVNVVKACTEMPMPKGFIGVPVAHQEHITITECAHLIVKLLGKGIINYDSNRMRSPDKSLDYAVFRKRIPCDITISPKNAIETIANKIRKYY